MEERHHRKVEQSQQPKPAKARREVASMVYAAATSLIGRSMAQSWQVDQVSCAQGVCAGWEYNIAIIVIVYTTSRYRSSIVH